MSSPPPIPPGGPWPFPPPAAPPPAPPPPPPVRRARNWGVVAAIAVIVVSVLGTIVGLVFYVAVAGDPADLATPRQAVHDYLIARYDYDCETLMTLLSEKLLADNGGRRASLDDCEAARAQVEEGTDAEIS